MTLGEGEWRDGRSQSDSPSKLPQGVSCLMCGGALAVPWWGKRPYVHDGVHRFWLTCEDCKASCLNPVPSPEAIGALYSSDYLGLHDPEDQSIQEQKNSSLMDFVQNFRPHRIADWGCGSGVQVQALSAAGLNVMGFEFDQATAEEVSRKTGCQIRMTADWKDFVGFFDAVLLNDVLEHVPDPTAVLDQVRSVLAPGGLLRIDTPLEGGANVFSLAQHANDRLRRRTSALIPPYHLHLLTMKSVRRLLTSSGWAIVKEENYNVMWPAPRQWHDARRGGSRAMLSFGTQKLSVALTGLRLGAWNRAIIVARR